jgi:predicted RNA-binding Zn-ribbon protein involved in translation (DUF1610 family)
MSGEALAWFLIAVHLVTLVVWFIRRKIRCVACDARLREPHTYCMQCGEPPEGKARCHEKSVIDRFAIMQQFRHRLAYYVAGIFCLFAVVLYTPLGMGTKILVLGGSCFSAFLIYMFGFMKQSRCTHCGQFVPIAEVKARSECFCPNCGAHVVSARP